MVLQLEKHPVIKTKTVNREPYFLPSSDLPILEIVTCSYNQQTSGPRPTRTLLNIAVPELSTLRPLVSIKVPFSIRRYHA